MTDFAFSAPSDVESLEILRANCGVNCQPSPESIGELQNSDLVLMSGQFVGGGKSTFIEDLEKNWGRVNIPSWTNRDLRPGEKEGVDKIQATLPGMAQRALEGYFLELEEVRKGMFYATPAEFSPGRGYVKDLELKGALRLRSFAPELPIIIPLPPLGWVEPILVTEWERRVGSREGYDSGISDKAITNLASRLEGVVEEADRIEELDLTNDPNTLVIVNDDLFTARQAMHRFLATGEKQGQEGLETHLLRLRQLASTALDQTA